MADDYHYYYFGQLDDILSRLSALNNLVEAVQSRPDEITELLNLARLN